VKTPRIIHTIKLSRLAWLITLTFSGFFPLAQGRDYFNPEFLEIDDPSLRGADLSTYESGNLVPGVYHVDVIVNGNLAETRDIDFKPGLPSEAQDNIQPCITIEMLQSWGVKTAQFPALASGNECANLAAIPKATSDFLFSSQRLILNIPQAAMDSHARGYVDPKLWDQGINAAMLNYSLAGANNFARSGNGSNTNSQYANLRPGLNVGPWRVRNYSTWNRDEQGEDTWENVYTYAQRDIIALRSQLTLGDSSSPSDVFDSVPFRGGQLASDDDMLPDSMRGYAPVVRGIARTNAEVTIRQNGYVIYQNYMPAGAFVIDDMYPTGGAGDLYVTIKEADGSEQHLIVPFASLPVMQREGQFKYSFTGGQYRSYNSSTDKTPFAQATGIFGLPMNFTLYGGFQESSKYQSLALGLGKNMGDMGALSADITHAWSSPNKQPKDNGQSLRLRYNKNFQNTGTDVAIAGYRYSTKGYYALQEIMDTYSEDNILTERRRNRAELTVSQAFGASLGALTVSAAREDYWNSDKTMESYSLGYNNSWDMMTYSVTYTYSKNGSAGEYGNTTNYDKDQILALNISVPLDRLLPNSWANYGVSASKNNGTTHTLGLSGMALQNNALNWNIQQGYGTNDQSYNGSLNADYKGTYGEMTAGYSYDQNSERTNYGLQGAVVAHEDGITLSQPLGETNVLIKAPGAAGVSIINQTGGKTDFRGYGIVNNVTNYRKNDVSLDTSTLPDNVELELTTRTVIPTRGAIVRADYVANVGDRALITIKKTNEKYLPFGAQINVQGMNNRASIVGEDGQVYLSGLEKTGVLHANWGNKTEQQCDANYSLADKSDESGLYIFDAVCQ